MSASSNDQPHPEPRRRVVFRRLALAVAGLGIAHFTISAGHWVQLVPQPWSLRELAEWASWEGILIPAVIAIGLLTVFVGSFVRTWRMNETGPALVTAATCLAAAVFVFDVANDRTQARLYRFYDMTYGRTDQDLHYYATWWWLNDANGRIRIHARLVPPW